MYWTAARTRRALASLSRYEPSPATRPPPKTRRTRTGTRQNLAPPRYTVIRLGSIRFGLSWPTCPLEVARQLVPRYRKTTYFID